MSRHRRHWSRYRSGLAPMLVWTLVGMLVAGWAFVTVAQAFGDLGTAIWR